MATKPSTVEAPKTEAPKTEAVAATPETAAPAAAAPTVGAAGVGATKEGNVVKLASGERRVDYIKRRFAEGATRGAIAKELGVPYQIVFAATKKKAEAAPAASAAVQAAANAVATPAATAQA
jgi:hypothetical protein